MENINLCKILKGHEGETFYSPLLCDLILEKIDIAVVYFRYGSSLIEIPYHGKDLDNKVCIFPSKDQRDWNKWIEKQKSKVPKTWSELGQSNDSHIYGIEHRYNDDYYVTREGITSIEKSALALLKIHQLIEIGYGGNVDRKYIDKAIYYDYPYYYIGYNHTMNSFYICKIRNKQEALILFRENIYAEEFLKYPENVQLLKDYFQIN